MYILKNEMYKLCTFHFLGSQNNEPTKLNVKCENEMYILKNEMYKLCTFNFLGLQNNEPRK